VAVDWVDDRRSSVNVSSTAAADLRGVCRVLWSFMRGGGRVDLGPLERRPLVEDFGRQTVSYALIGAVSAAISLGLFLVLRDEIGAIWANIIAFSATTVGNNWANRRWTFRQRGAEGRWWHIAGSTIVFLGTIAVSTIGLAAVQGDSVAELVVLLVTWGLAGVCRFFILRSWVYRRASAGHR
jgi:putative flippase GtrA